MQPQYWAESSGIVISCPRCGMKNRQAFTNLGDSMNCSRCRSRLPIVGAPVVSYHGPWSWSSPASGAVDTGIYRWAVTVLGRGPRVASPDQPRTTMPRPMSAASRNRNAIPWRLTSRTPTCPISR